jgi:hypothetical protein
LNYIDRVDLKGEHIKFKTIPLNAIPTKHGHIFKVAETAETSPRAYLLLTRNANSQDAMSQPLAKN